MQENTMQGLVLVETPQFLLAESTEENTAQKENAQEIAALEASEVACATLESTTEYSTDATTCQIVHVPTLEELETALADAARQRIESVRLAVEQTHERITQEQNEREKTLEAMQTRASQIQTALDGLAGERAAMENRARAFVNGDGLTLMLGQIELAFNARQLELEDTLAVANTDVPDAQSEIQLAQVSDALELQLIQQELERLESIAPDVAQAIHRAETVVQLIANARQAIQDGMLRDAATLIEQLTQFNADAATLDELEQLLAEARKAQLARDLIARLNTNPEQLGALKRIRRIMDEAEAAGIAHQIASAAMHAQDMARQAANARYAQARPIADHLVAEGFVPVVGDGRIEAWLPVTRAAADVQPEHDQTWTLDHILVLRSNDVWHTEQPRFAITRKELTPRMKHSRWYRAWLEQRNQNSPQVEPATASVL